MASVIKAGNATDGVQVTSDNTGILELKTGTGSGTTAMTVGTDQSVTFAGRTTNPTTISVGNATPSTSGSGITFPATQSASSNANTLDDYEEGTFEPIALGSSTAGTGTYTLQAGRYTKIGRVCFFQFTIGWSAFTGTGDLNLGGLPFTSLGADGEVVAGQSAATIGYVNGLSFTNQPNMYIPLNNTILVFTQTTTGGVVSGIPIDTAVSELIINGHYIVA